VRDELANDRAPALQKSRSTDNVAWADERTNFKGSYQSHCVNLEPVRRYLRLCGRKGCPPYRSLPSVVLAHTPAT
jgi:hypothetical protein